MKVELIKEFHVEAAHRDLHSTGVGRQLHGHSLCIEIIAEGEVDPVQGWLIDYGDIKRAFKPIHDQLDHHYINDIQGVEKGSLGDVAAWIRMRLKPALPSLKDVRVTVVGVNRFELVELEEDVDRDLPARLQFAFEAAQRLPHLPPEHPCSRLHGHTYRVEVAAANLGGLYDPLRLLYDQLDHNYLNDIPDLNEATSERLCGWIWNRLSERVDDLLAVVVQETATARCIYRGQ